MKTKFLIAALGFVLVIGVVLFSVFKSPTPDSSTTTTDTSGEVLENDKQSQQDNASEIKTDAAPDDEIEYYEGYGTGMVEYKPMDWTAGEGTELKKSRVEFLDKDYGSPQLAWSAAYDYGLSSAGEFYIIDSYDLDTDEWCGYITIIRETK